MVSSFSYSGQIKEVVFSEKQFQNVTGYFQKAISKYYRVFSESNFKMFWGIFGKAISKCVGVFVLEFEFLCHLDLSQQAFGITVVLWIPIRGIGLLIVLWTTVWCYTKRPTF